MEGRESGNYFILDNIHKMCATYLYPIRAAKAATHYGILYPESIGVV